MQSDVEKQNASSTVLDASALLAFVLDEQGAETVKLAMLEGAAISGVNLAEVVSRLVDYGFSDEAAIDFGGLGLSLVDFSESQARASGLLRRATKHLGLSLGDRACLALAQELGLPVLTADRLWSQLDLGVEVRIIR